MAYQYRLTPQLKELVDAAEKNGGLLYRSQIRMIVSNEQSTFYKLRKLGYEIVKKPIGEKGKNYCVHIYPPKGAWNFEQWFFEKLDLPTRWLLISLVIFGFLMLAKLFSEIF